MSKQCYICKKEVGLLSFRLNFDNGDVICADCAKKAGLKSQKDIEGVSISDVTEWVKNPEKRQEYIDKQIEEQKKIMEEAELKAEEERIRRKKEADEAERIRLEEEKKEKEKKEQWEREHFPNGRVHTSVFHINVTNWSELDNYIQKIQDKGNEIINVCSTGLAFEDNSTAIIITYRKTTN